MPTVNRGLYNWLFHGGAVLEDFADRLSHVWTVGLLLVCASIISWKQNINDAIKCNTPLQFSDAHVAYAHAACYGSYHYYMPFNTEAIPIPKPGDPRFTGWLYKWLPVVLCIQAILFKLPNITMHVLHGYSGISFEKIEGITNGHENLNLSDRKQLGNQAGRYLYNWCNQWPTFLPWRMLSILWLIVKILYTVNAVIQFVLVDRLLSTRNPPFDNTTSYGDTIYANLFNSSVTEWKQSPIFPRIILCDYFTRAFNNIHRYTHQCELPINEFTEYVYMIIWIWLLIVAVTSCLSLLTWLVLTVLPFPRQRYVSKMLELAENGANKPTRPDTDRLASLVGEDGVMVLKLMSSNSSELFVRDVVSTMCQLSRPQQAFNYALTGPDPCTSIATAPTGPVHVAYAGPTQTTTATIPEKQHMP